MKMTSPGVCRRGVRGKPTVIFMMSCLYGDRALFANYLPNLRSCQLFSYSRILHFMESEGSLPCSQRPASSPYPEPDESSPYHAILSNDINSTSRYYAFMGHSRFLPPELISPFDIFQDPCRRRCISMVIQIASLSSLLLLLLLL
jgi:hypothetical protein